MTDLEINIAFAEWRWFKADIARQVKAGTPTRVKWGKKNPPACKESSLLAFGVAMIKQGDK